MGVIVYHARSLGSFGLCFASLLGYGLQVTACRELARACTPPSALQLYIVLFTGFIHIHGGSLPRSGDTVAWAKSRLPDGGSRREGCQMDGLDEAHTAIIIQLLSLVSAPAPECCVTPSLVSQTTRCVSASAPGLNQTCTYATSPLIELVLHLRSPLTRDSRLSLSHVAARAHAILGVFVWEQRGRRRGALAGQRGGRWGGGHRLAGR